MPLDRQGINAGAWSGRPPHRPAPQLPAFCRTRRPTVMVTASSLAGPVPPRPVSSANTVFRPAAGTDAGEVPPVTAFSDR